MFQLNLALLKNLWIRVTVIMVTSTVCATGFPTLQAPEGLSTIAFVPSVPMSTWLRKSNNQVLVLV